VELKSPGVVIGGPNPAKCIIVANTKEGMLVIPKIRSAGKKPGLLRGVSSLNALRFKTYCRWSGGFQDLPALLVRPRLGMGGIV